MLHAQNYLSSGRSDVNNASSSFRAEGLALVDRLWSQFWRQDLGGFAAKLPSAETILPKNEYILWPVIIAIQALIEAERTFLGYNTENLVSALEALEKYKSPEYGGYCAWHYSSGDDDIYFDDNAQVAIAQISAYGLTGRKEYLGRAVEVVKFIQTGWDSSKGGVRWHVRTSGPPYTDRNACSTMLTAIACLRLAGLDAIDDKTRRQCISFAEEASTWTVRELKSDQGLIMDGFNERQGRIVINPTTWTYNTGMTIAALSSIYSIRPTEQTKQWAVELVNAAVDRSKGLFDLSVHNRGVRYWWDSTFFIHLLMEGFMVFLDAFTATTNAGLVARVKDEVERHMNYLIQYVKDEHDELYFRNLRLYKIGNSQLSQFRSLTGDEERQLEPDASERVDGSSNPSQRSLTKTLLGNGGAARALLIAACIKYEPEAIK